MALWPIAETLGFAMEQTLNNWKHSVYITCLESEEKGTYSSCTHR